MKTEILTGNLIVTKNPCTYPGDIRLLKTLDEDDKRLEKFKDYVNVVVFPSVGKRPEQHKMSGGDLDGDVYMVLWDPDILAHMSFDQIEGPAVYKKFLDESR